MHHRLRSPSRTTCGSEVKHPLRAQDPRDHGHDDLPLQAELGTAASGVRRVHRREHVGTHTGSGNDHGARARHHAPPNELPRVVFVLERREIRPAADEHLQRLVGEPRQSPSPVRRCVQAPETGKRPDHDGDPGELCSKPSPDCRLGVKGVNDGRALYPKDPHQLPKRVEIAHRSHTTRHSVAAISQAVLCERIG